LGNYYQKILGEYFLAAPCRNVLFVFIAHVDLLGVYRDAAITRIWDLLISRRMRLLTCCFQTAEDYQRVYGQRTSATSRSKFHGYAYDAVWTIALAVDSVIADRRGRYEARDFRGGGAGRLHAALNRTDFVGVTVSSVQPVGGR